MRLHVQLCLIPFARGRERSRVAEDVLREARELAGHGYKELVLTGVNIGRYAYNGMELVDLIAKLKPSRTWFESAHLVHRTDNNPSPRCCTT